MALQVALIVPPMSDLNTPYASIPRLAGWVRKLGHDVKAIDLSLELFLRMHSRSGLTRLFDAIRPEQVPLDLEDVYLQRERYIRIIDSVVAFAQGRDLSLSHAIVRGNFLPEGPNFRTERDSVRRAAFGEFGRLDLARHLIALMFMDLAALLRSTIAPHYNLTTYGERLADSRDSYDMIAVELARPPNAIELMIMEAAADTIPADVDLLCFTCPFPGNLLGALFLGTWAATHRPRARRAMGGGYPSTELRELRDPRPFDAIDYLVLDDGEIPLQQICARIEGQDVPLERTFTREAGTVVYHKSEACVSPRFRDLPTPDYNGVGLDRYIHAIFRRNRVPRLLTEGLWLKLTAAHGCYWKKCTFCDIHLSYIGDFDPLSPVALADQMDTLHQTTGLSGFHFTDEAAPPPLLVKLAVELLRRGRAYHWWGNIRFDPGFTVDRCRTLAAAGMIAVSGGIEIASDELLPKIAKGITIQQVIRVLYAFSQAGIMTHAYLIYGFPGETRQDTINSLEILRQLMRARLLHSAYYHRFSATTHSPIGRNPELFGVRIKGPQPGGFARYVLQHEPPHAEHITEKTFQILSHVMASYDRGERLDRDVKSWLSGSDFPAPTVDPELVARVLEQEAQLAPPKNDAQLLWLGSAPSWRRGLLSVGTASGDVLSLRSEKRLAELLTRCHPTGWTRPTPPVLSDFEQQEWWQPFRSHGLVLI